MIEYWIRQFYSSLLFSNIWSAIFRFPFFIIKIKGVVANPKFEELNYIEPSRSVKIRTKKIETKIMKPN